MSSDKKKWNKTEKGRKNMEKENNTDESGFIAIEIPDLIEAGTRGILWKKVFLEVFKNSQENTCVRVPFLIELQARACNFI